MLNEVASEKEWAKKNGVLVALDHVMD